MNNLYNLIQKHCKEIITTLVDRKLHFCILCEIKYVNFEPKLPPEIKAKFQDLTLFVLSGYTFESINIEKSSISFEAGFGTDNIGSVVDVPFDCILQILAKEEKLLEKEFPIFVNMPKGLALAGDLQEGQAAAIKNSLEALLSNPKNSKFIK